MWASSLRVCFFFSFFVARRCEGLGVCPCLVCVCRCLLFSTTAFPSFVFGTGDAAVPRAKQVRCASSRPPLLWRCVSFLPKAHGPTMATRHERIRASLCLALPVRCNVRPAVQQCHPDPSSPPPGRRSRTTSGRICGGHAAAAVGLGVAVRRPHDN